MAKIIVPGFDTGIDPVKSPKASPSVSSPVMEAAKAMGSKVFDIAAQQALEHDKDMASQAYLAYSKSSRKHMQGLSERKDMDATKDGGVAQEYGNWSAKQQAVIAEEMGITGRQAEFFKEQINPLTERNLDSMSRHESAQRLSLRTKMADSKYQDGLDSIAMKPGDSATYEGMLETMVTSGRDVGQSEGEIARRTASYATKAILPLLDKNPRKAREFFDKHKNDLGANVDTVEKQLIEAELAGEAMKAADVITAKHLDYKDQDKAVATEKDPSKRKLMESRVQGFQQDKDHATAALDKRLRSEASVAIVAHFNADKDKVHYNKALTNLNYLRGDNFIAAKATLDSIYGIGGKGEDKKAIALAELNARRAVDVAHSKGEPLDDGLLISRYGGILGERIVKVLEYNSAEGIASKVQDSDLIRYYKMYRQRAPDANDTEALNFNVARQFVVRELQRTGAVASDTEIGKLMAVALQTPGEIGGKGGWGYGPDTDGYFEALKKSPAAADTWLPDVTQSEMSAIREELAKQGVNNVTETAARIYKRLAPRGGRVNGTGLPTSKELEKLYNAELAE